MAKLILPFAFVALLPAFYLAVGEPNRLAERPRPKITVSRETTYITEPLGKDGNIDYVAALNAMASKGVTPENNVVTACLRILGPDGIDKKIRKRYFKLLGISELPEKGDYFTPFDNVCVGVTGDDFVKAHDQWELSQKRPWTKKDFPLVAKFVEQNAKQLDALVECAKLPHYYSPLVASDESRIMSSLNLVNANMVRSAARGLLSRAMLRLQENEIAAAQTDILASWHLVQSVGQGPLVIDRVISSVGERYVANAMMAMVQFGGLTAEQAQKLRLQFCDAAQLSSIPKINRGERLFTLGGLQDVAKLGSRWVGSWFMYGYDKPEAKLLVQLADDPQLDWDEAFRCTNEWADRMELANKKTSAEEHRKSAAKLKDDLAKAVKNALEPLSAEESRSPQNAAKAKARRLAVLLNKSWSGGDTMFIAESNRKAFNRLTVAALALAEYHAECGSYPKSLADLMPKYLAETPQDPFTDGPLHYKLESGGFVLYSVGVNGKDDGGHNYLAEHNYNPPANGNQSNANAPTDDLAVRVTGKIEEGTREKVKK